MRYYITGYYFLAHLFVQFTTLENTPPEFLMLGSIARQAYTADTFALGLSFLHLLIGYEPYEELLADIRCPLYLKVRLNHLWACCENVDDPFYVIREVIESMMDDKQLEIFNRKQQNNGKINTRNGRRQFEFAEGADILFDTMYRYLVLLGESSTDFTDIGSKPDAANSSPWCRSVFSTVEGHQTKMGTNPVWSSISDALGTLICRSLAKSMESDPSSTSEVLIAIDDKSLADTVSRTIDSPLSKVISTQSFDQSIAFGSKEQAVDLQLACIRRYHEDARIWSIRNGSHSKIKRFLC